MPEIAGRWENARTDVPMLAYHASTPNADGTRTIEYTVIWSNEDGGTNSPALMARWGRTTDIEWIYRVRVDAAGNALAAVYHGAEPRDDAVHRREGGRPPAAGDDDLEQQPARRSTTRR